MALLGKMGRIAFVNLSDRKVEIERLDDSIYEQYLGGYGLGAYILFTRQRAKVNPLGSAAMLGFVAGPLTGTPAITGNRYAVVGKSPKTGTWGDANSGGFFGPALKRSGFDAIFVKGIADEPVMLVAKNGRLRIVSAKNLWGLDSNETEDRLKKRYGNAAQIACIGPVGERAALLACVMNNKGRAAGRSGLGAVMGSKKLKAIVCLGGMEVKIADPERMEAVRKKCLAEMKNVDIYHTYSTYGTCGITAAATAAGDTPIKNWKGVPKDIPDVEKISDEAAIAYEYRKFACWRCPIGCGGHVRVKSGPYATDGHKPEYETIGTFGVMCLNTNMESIIKVNDICNRYGMDTISTGCTIAFMMECYEQGVVSQKDLDGIDLRWGNHEAIVALTEKIAKGEGIGKLLQDGMKAAAERIGRGAEKFAMHIQGEELPMHDPRCYPGLAMSYKMDATPGRHTQLSAWAEESGFTPPGLPVPKIERYVYTGKAKAHRMISNFMHVANAAGLCMFGIAVIPHTAMPEFLSAAMGREFTLDDVDEIGSRIAALRTAFNVREGMLNIKFRMPPRVLGKPPLKEGPLKGITVDDRTQIREYLKEMGWDVRTGKPKKETLKKLNLEFAVRPVWGRT